MGRFSHEAAAIDPATGYVYLTEDLRNASGFYRFIPNHTKGKLGSLEAGGRLQAAKVVGTRNTSLITARRCDEYMLEWIDIPHPDREAGEVGAPQLARLQSQLARQRSLPSSVGRGRIAVRARRGSLVFGGQDVHR